MDWIRQIFLRRRMREELTQEIAQYLEEKIAGLAASGVSRKDAEHQARREFGNVTLLEERSREIWQWSTLESICADVSYASRQLRKAPLFAAAAVLTLALGIGANTAVFSLFDSVLLHPLPYRNSSRLMLVTEIEPKVGADEFGVSIQEARDYQDRSHSFSQMATFESTGFNLTGVGRPLRVNAAMVSDSLFPLLQVQPILGRTFTSEEDRYGSPHVAVLSWQLWQSQYHGDPQIVGKAIRLDETPYTVIGVMPASFRFPFDGKPLSEMADLWVPDAIAPSRLNPQNRLMEFGVGLVGRLRPGVTENQARAEMTQIANAFESEHKDIYTGPLRVIPHTYAFAGYSMQKARPLIWLLSAAVACVLFIACANVASLLLARGSHRSQEMAVRAALGADRVRLIRQCLVESLVLSAAGAVSGLAIAQGILLIFRIWGPQSVPRLHEASLHPLVLLFTLLLTLCTGVLFGFVPAWQLSHVSSRVSLNSSRLTGPTRSSQRLHDLIVTCEIALAAALLIAGGLLVHSFARLLDTPFGFDPNRTSIIRTVFDRNRYPDPVRRNTVQRLMLERLSHLPGIGSAAAASHLPLSDERQIGVRLEDAAADDFHWADNSLVSPGYFRAMGISLLRGRDFNDQDRADSTPVAIVNQAFVSEYLPGRDPLGQRFYWGDRKLFTIAGVTTDVHIAALDADPSPMVYNSIFQVESGASGRTAFVLRSKDDSVVPIEEVQMVIWSLDHDLPIYDVTSLATLVEQSLAQRRFTLLLLGGFALSAVLLAMIGLFGVLSYLVEQREREIGVRMALGADRGRILALITRKGLLLGTVGCASGLLLSALSANLLRTSLYHVSRFDPVTLMAVPLLLFFVVMLSVWIPARRAASVDPMQALRAE